MIVSTSGVSPSKLFCDPFKTDTVLLKKFVMYIKLVLGSNVNLDGLLKPESTSIIWFSVGEPTLMSITTTVPERTLLT